MPYLANNLDLPHFCGLFPVSSCLRMGDDVCLIDVRYDSSLSILAHPCRFDGFLALFCVTGSIRVMINLREFEVKENSMFLYMPGNIMSVCDVDEASVDSLHFVVIAMTKEYMEGLDVDVPGLIEKRVKLMDRPYFFFGDDGRQVAEHYVSLAADILRSNLGYKRESVSALLSSFFFIAGGIIEQEMSMTRPDTRKPDRSHEVFEKFLGLLSEYHMEERSVSFYADKLCLTPKYLSRLVKTATGRNAPAWIDDYVILEAKNMLRYSDLPVKEIVAHLHFPDPPAFCRFFRKKTGVTPVRYRKGEGGVS